MLKDKCIACDQTNCLSYFKEEDKMYSCNQCAAIFVENEFDGKQAFYKESYAPRFFERIFTRLIHVYISKLYSDEYIHYLKLKTKIDFKNALDIGAKYGTLVEDLNKIGIDAHGIESDQRCMQLGVTKKIKWIYFDENYQSDVKYDLICLPQMIYYLPNSYAILKCVKNMLTPNGLIFIATYNPESMILKNKLKPYMGNNINMILSKNNFESLNDKLGLEMLDYTTYTSNVSLDFATNRNTTIAFLKYRLKLKKGLVLNPNGFFAFVLLKNISKS